MGDRDGSEEEEEEEEGSWKLPSEGVWRVWSTLGGGGGGGDVDRPEESYPTAVGGKAVVAGLYRRDVRVGEGSYGAVCTHRATSLVDNRVVALKKIRMDYHTGEIPTSAKREMEILRRLSPECHPNIVQLIDVVNGEGGKIFLVMEYLPHTLLNAMHDSGFPLSMVRLFMKQALAALEFVHGHGIMHRDVKSSNFLVDKNNTLKLADFGLAREIPTKRSHGHDVLDVDNSERTLPVATLWYRAPELLLGDTHYDEKVDIWAVGCLLSELLEGKPVFCGRSEIDQMQQIFDLLGTPDEIQWPGAASLPYHHYLNLDERIEWNLPTRFPTLREDALDLLSRLLALDPARRPTAAQARHHQFLTEETISPQRVQVGTKKEQGETKA